MSWIDDWRNGLSPTQKEYILALAQAETQVYWRIEYHALGLRVHLVKYRGEVFTEPDGRQLVISGQTTGEVISLWTPYWWWRYWRTKLRDRREAKQDKKNPVPPARLLP